MVDFAGWDLPIHYGSQLDEHHAVRRGAGMFDVSHMTVMDLHGDGADAFLQRLVANDVGRLKATGKALYGALLDEHGCILDDLIVYKRADGYRAVVNAATRDKVTAWFGQHAPSFDVVVEERRDLAMIAVQGPSAVARFAEVTGRVDVLDLEAFSACLHDDWMIGRTGYTGEDGVEIMLPGADAVDLWRALAEAGVRPVGLGARDTLRLEAGLNLYGQDMDETTTPLESNIAWTVAWEPLERDFIGRAALTRQRLAKPKVKLTGVVLEARAVMRHGMTVSSEAGEGVVTSGIFSPTLGYSIGFARVPRAAKGKIEIEIRRKAQPGRIVKPPFVRHGEKQFE